jgi:hypothetical protein
MRLVVRHGHFAFFPDSASEIPLYVELFETPLVRENDYFTFPGLVGVPRWSIATLAYKNLVANKTFEGRTPWDAMKANGFVATAGTGVLVPKSSITSQVNPPLAGYYFLAEIPLIQPGSRDATGRQILSYSGVFRQERQQQLAVIEYSYE